MNKLSTAQLANYLAVTKRTIQRRAVRENWAFEEEIGLGGTKRLYLFATLPQQVKTKVVASIIASHDKISRNPNDPEAVGNPPFSGQFAEDPATWLTEHCFSHTMHHTELNKGYVKLGLLTLARNYVTQSGLGKIKGFDVFCQQYNDHKLTLDATVYLVIKRISRISLLRWEKKEQELAMTSRTTDIGTNQDQIFDNELRTMAAEVLMVSPTITAKRLRQHFLTFFCDKKIPNEDQLSLWIEQNTVTG